MSTLKILKEIASQYYLTQVIEDFLNMSVAAFSLGKDEERYSAAAKKYTEQDLKKFGTALGALILEYENGTDNQGTWCDVLGTLFEEANSKSNATNKGQFFTPVSLCNLMAQTLIDTDGQTVCDPTCGSGRNLIAHSRLKPENRINSMYYGMDLDLRCCLMTVINMVMYGMKGYVIHMNTLSMEIYKGWRVYLAETGMCVFPISEQECRSALTEKSAKEAV
jgi:type I restriction enzyme M protein